MTLTTQLPAKPNLVLRIGFAGNRDLPADTGPLEAALHSIFATLAQRLQEIAQGNLSPHDVPTIARFYSPTRPVLRLITGLAEGADALAAQVLMRISNSQVQTEHGAVLPFDVATY